jgi:hypothetical protein
MIVLRSFLRSVPALLACAILMATPCLGQEPVEPEARSWLVAGSPETPFEQPLQTAADDIRSPVLAGALELLLPIPTLGYAYAGNWRRGLLPGGVQVLGVFVLAYGVTDTVVEGVVTGDDDATCGAACAVGIAMILGGRVWSTVGAARTAQSWNLERGSSLSLQWVPAPGGVGLLATYRF